MKAKKLSVILLVIIAIALPLLLLGIRQTLINKSKTASADELEAEGETLGGNSTSQSKSQVSGENYVSLGMNQTTTPPAFQAM